MTCAHEQENQMMITDMRLIEIKTILYLLCNNNEWRQSSFLLLIVFLRRNRYKLFLHFRQNVQLTMLALTFFSNKKEKIVQIQLVSFFNANCFWFIINIIQYQKIHEKLWAVRWVASSYYWVRFFVFWSCVTAFSMQCMQNFRPLSV